MITLKRSGAGFKITFSSGIPGEHGFTTKAKNIPEVHLAIDHYYGDTSHDTLACPLCRVDKKRREKHDSNE